MLPSRLMIIKMILTINTVVRASDATRLAWGGTEGSGFKPQGRRAGPGWGNRLPGYPIFASPWRPVAVILAETDGYAISPVTTKSFRQNW